MINPSAMRPTVVRLRPPTDVAQLIISLSSQFFGNSVGLSAPPTQRALQHLRAELAVAHASGDFHLWPDCCHFNSDSSVPTVLREHADALNVFAIFPHELKRKKPARQKEQAFHHNVYVILLRDTVTKHRSILRLNPKRNPLKPCMYVGMTGVPVDHRFENHKKGYKSAWVVRKYGVRLMPELYEHLNPMPFEGAVQMELELAEDLRAAGYTVTGGH